MSTLSSWTVLGEPNSNHKILCRCSCGKEKLVSVYSLRDGTSTKCISCSRKAGRPGRRVVASIPYKISAKLRGAVKNAISRCTDKTHRQYPDYGGRGIKIHQVWLDNPHIFVAYLAGLDGHEELTLDRINNNGNYEPGNLRFVSMVQSAHNRRKKKTTIMLTHNGRTQRPYDWAKELGISLTTLLDRLDRDWSIEKAITTPGRRYSR